MICWLLDRIAHLPRPLLRGSALLLGDLWFYLLRIRRRVAERNVAGSAVDPGRGGRSRLVRSSCQHLVWNLLELPRWVDEPDLRRFDRAIRVRGAHHLRRAHQRGRGLIVVTAHLGSWELLGAAARRVGLPVSLVVRPLAGGRAQRWVSLQRRRSGVGVIEEGCGQLARIRRTLLRGEAVGMTVDQRPRAGSVPAEFLGRRVRVSRAPASLALRTGAALVVVTIHREGGFHRVVVEPPIWPRRDRRPVGDQVAELARSYTSRIELAIAAHPEQWLWHHRRFADPPEAA